MSFPVEMKWIHTKQEMLGVKFPASFVVAIAGVLCGDLMILLPMERAPDTLQPTIYWWDHETGV